MDAKYDNLLSDIRNEKKITDETEKALIEALDNFSETFSA